MNSETNIIKILTAKTKSGGGYTRVKNGAGKLIDGLWVNHVSDYDYLLFDFTSAKIDPDFKQIYNAFEKKVEVNPATKNIALHIRIEASLRNRLATFYDELCANYDPTNTDDSIDEIIEEWAYLFESIKSKRLSREEEVGLFGELLTLKQLYAHGHKNAIEHWFGPAGELHDFKKDPEWILEVKTSVSPNPVVKVGKIDQLEPQSLPFNLLLVKLVREKSSGKCLPELIEEIEKLLKSAKEKQRLWVLLNGMGYLDADKKNYKQKYELIEFQRYKIEPGKTITLCPSNINSKAKYKSARWYLTASEYPMVICDDKFWKKPV